MDRTGPALAGNTGSDAVRALRTLPIHHRQVLRECYFRGASVVEAAQTLGVSVATVKSRTHHALHALRRAFDTASGV